MSDPARLDREEALLRQIVDLRAEVAALTSRINQGELRLGPQPVSQANIDATTERLIEALKDAKPALCTTSGEPVAKVRAEQTNETGQHKSYVVLCPDERAKGFVRPVRTSYRHLPCGSTTKMGQALSETYARNPAFYSGTFCCHCNAHFALDQFVWEGTNEQVGS